MIPSPGSEVGTVGEALAQCPLQQREEAAMSAEINVIDHIRSAPKSEPAR